MQHDLILQLRVVLGIPLAPVITHRIRKDIPRPVESCTRNWATRLGIPFQSMFCIFIPEMKCAVRASSAKGTMDRMEADCVDAIDVTDIPLRWGGLSVAFEAEVGGRVFVFNILYCAATLYAADSKAAAIAKAGDDARLPF